MSQVLVYLPADRCDLETVNAVFGAIRPPVTVTIERAIKVDGATLFIEKGQELRAGTPQVPPDTE